MDLVSIVVPTLNRPAPLQRAIRSLAAQRGLDDVAIEIFIVDNSTDGNARAVVDRLRADIAIPLIYLEEPSPGVSNARNTGVRAAQGRWIAFLDDDEEADHLWIASLVAVARRSGADAVFGAVDAKSETSAAMDVFGRYFIREIDAPDGSDVTDKAAYLGTNNSLFERRRCLTEPAPFDVSLNRVGGEDSLLLKRLTMTGRRFAWAPKARVSEWVPESRLNWTYIRKRKFLSGQIRVFVIGMLRPVRWPAIMGWMAIGLVQFGLGALAMLALYPVGGARYAKASVMCCAGLGKILWMPRFRPALYGTGLVS